METIASKIKQKNVATRHEKNITHLDNVKKITPKKQVEYKFKDKVKEIIEGENQIRKNVIDWNVVKNDAQQKLDKSKEKNNNLVFKNDQNIFLKNNNKPEALFSSDSTKEQQQQYFDTLKNSKQKSETKSDFGTIYQSQKKDDYHLKLDKNIFKKRK